MRKENSKSYLDLLADIFNASEMDTKKLWGAYQELDSDKERGLAHVLQFLPEETQCMIKLRYEDRMTYETIQNIFGWEKHYVSKTILEGLKELTKELYLPYVLYGYEGAIEMKDEKNFYFGNDPEGSMLIFQDCVTREKITINPENGKVIEEDACEELE